MRRGDRLDLALILLAAAYLVFVGLGGAGHEWYASADRVADGRVWLLLTSALNVVVELDEVQWLMLAVVTAAVIYRLGPRLWWTVSLTGHVGSAIISYGLIEIAVALGSGSAEITARESDYGISIVLAAGLGALTASALLARERGDFGAADRAALIAGLAGLAGMFAVSFGWYDIQHLIGYVIGFLLTRFLVGRKVWGIGAGGRFETPR
ncbi:MAG TPA: hypothetical protein VMF31_07795 [Solirubrobacterales bacterium]|nr:hypothetical protein [Solirubrobacterales bacterium]